MNHSHKKKVMKKLFIVTILLVMISCTSDSDDGMNDPPAKNVTYTDTIKVIIDNNCLNCHVDPPVNGASMPLITIGANASAGLLIKKLLSLL